MTAAQRAAVIWARGGADVAPMTLTPYINRYTTARRLTGELCEKSAHNGHYTLIALAQVHGGRPLSQFGRATIERYRETIGHLAPATRRNKLSKVHTFCRWMVDEGHLRTDPTSHLRPVPQPRKVPVTFTLGDVGRLLHHIGDDQRATAIVWLMFGCGARCVEVSRLQVEHYDSRAATIVLTGKAAHERTVPVPAPVAEALDRYLDSMGRVGGPLIRSGNNASAGICPATISMLVSQWLVDAGVKTRQRDGRSAHGLRRTAGSNLMDASENIRIVQAFLGHARIETTARFYLRDVTTAQMRAALELVVWTGDDHEPNTIEDAAA